MPDIKKAGTLKIFSGNANLPLATELCNTLGVQLGKVRVGRFADGEIDVQIQENVRGCDCYVVQPTCTPVNENVMRNKQNSDSSRSTTHRHCRIFHNDRK